MSTDKKVAAMLAALEYVADMTYCGTDAEWHFKAGYDPQVVLDAIAEALASEAPPAAPPNEDHFKGGHRRDRPSNRCGET